MASSFHWNAASSCLQRFNDYLNGLRGEFELQPNATVLKSRRFYLRIGNLRGDFELMAEDVEALRKEVLTDEGALIDVPTQTLSTKTDA